MKTNPIDMGKGPLLRSILRFSVPLMLSNMLQILFNMADIAVVGRFAGSQALGAVGSTSILISMYTMFLIGMGGGINVLTAQALGAEDRERTGRFLHSGLLISVLTGMAVLVFGLVSSRGILLLMHTRPLLLGGALIYLRIYLLGMPALAVYNYGSAVYSAAGEPRRPLLILSAAGTGNILLNLFFVLVCRLGVAGVALASVLSQYASAGMVLAGLRRRDDDIRLVPRKLCLSRAESLQILKLGVTTGIQNAIFMLANLFMQAGVNSFPEAVVAGNAAALNYDNLTWDIMAAVYAACASFMGRSYGAGNEERTRRSYRVSLALSAAIGAGMGLAVIFGSRPFLRLFTVDPEVVEAGRVRLLVTGLTYWISAFMDCTCAACRSLGRSVIPTVFVFLGSCLFRIIWIGTVFAYFHTTLSLYLLYPFSWVLTAIPVIWYYRRIVRIAFN